MQAVNAHAAPFSGDALLRLVADHFPSGILVVYDREYRYILAAGKGLADIGITSEQMVGSRPRDLFPPEFCDQLESHLEMAFSGTDETFEIMLGPQTFSQTVCPIITDGRIQSVLGVVVNISKRKREAELLNAKNKELERIIYVASHDLRSPLVNVDGYSRELEYAMGVIIAAIETGDMPEGGLEALLRREFPDITESLRHIRNSISQMDHLLKGLLTFSRSGRAELNIVELDMHTLVGNVISSLGFQVRESGATVQTESLPPCMGDAVQMTRVFANLIVNAIRYFDSDRPGMISVRGEVAHGRCTYCVEDNGIGIAAESIPFLFDLFYRINPDTTEGDGMGLAIVRQAVSRMNGNVSIESQVGVGTRFYIDFPAE